MTKILTIITLALSLTLVGCVSAPDRSVRCEEDQPCWDCHTMGNRVCGPVNE